MRWKISIASLGLVFMLQACTEESPGLVISHVVPPDNSCNFTSTDMKVANGKYDVFCARPYYVTLLVYSLTISLADPVRPRAEPNIIRFDNAEVHIEDLNGNQIADPFSVPVEGTLEPGTVSDPSWEMVMVEAIPSVVANTLNKNKDKYIDKKIIATFRLYGRTTGGTDVETGEYTFPIQICDGCFTFLADQDCKLSQETMDDFNAVAKGCQDGSGADGSYCICDPLNSGTKCESCLGL